MLATNAYEPVGWSDLFVGSAGAAAALTGLVFVAVSINIEPILKLAGLPERALMTLLLLLGAMVASLLGLIPDQSATALGTEMLVLGIAVGAACTGLGLRSLTPDARASWRISRITVPLLGTVPFAIGGLSLLLDGGGGLYWIVGGLVCAIAGAVINAWVLLVEILR